MLLPVAVISAIYASTNYTILPPAVPEVQCPIKLKSKLVPETALALATTITFFVALSGSASKKSISLEYPEVAEAGRVIVSV